IGALAAGRPASFDGVWGSACALVAAALAEHAPGPLVVVLPSDREADDTAADLELFTGHEPRFYPSWETAPDERLVHDETFGERLRVLKELLAKAQSPKSKVQNRPASPGTGPTNRSPGLGRFMKARTPTDSVLAESESATAEHAGENVSAAMLDLGPWTLDRTTSILVTSIQALLQPSPRRESIAASTRVVRKG